MPTLGILFVLAALLIGREVIVGRAKETPTDIKDLAVGFLNGDMKTVQSVLARRGSNTSAGSDALSSGVDGSPVPSLPALSGSSTGKELAREMITLGSAATGYVSGATGPQAYDCSGLVWKACRAIGIYSGPRFTTYTFPAAAKTFAKPTSKPAVGDICMWSRGKAQHMGVIVGPNLFYSARSPDEGINTATISGDSSYFGFQPSYWRPN